MRWHFKQQHSSCLCYDTKGATINPCWSSRFLVTLVIKNQYCPKRRFMSAAKVQLCAKSKILSSLDFELSFSIVPSFFTFLVSFFFFFFARHLLIFIFMGNVSGKRTIIWKEYRSVLEQDFYRNVRTSLTELLSFWHAIKYLFALHKLDDKAFIERWNWCCRRKRYKGRGSLEVVHLGGSVANWSGNSMLKNNLTSAGPHSLWPLLSLFRHRAVIHVVNVIKERTLMCYSGLYAAAKWIIFRVHEKIKQLQGLRFSYSLATVVQNVLYKKQSRLSLKVLLTSIPAKVSLVTIIILLMKWTILVLHGMVLFLVALRMVSWWNVCSYTLLVTFSCTIC